jgi:hypothetical protein
MAGDDGLMISWIFIVLSLLAGVALTFGAIYVIRPEYFRLGAKVARLVSIDLELRLPSATGASSADSIVSARTAQAEDESSKLTSEAWTSELTASRFPGSAGPPGGGSL